MMSNKNLSQIRKHKALPNLFHQLLIMLKIFHYRFNKCKKSYFKRVENY
jgi:hypothetical protein